jgi:hypothetical protein
MAATTGFLSSCEVRRMGGEKGASAPFIDISLRSASKLERLEKEEWCGLLDIFGD